MSASDSESDSDSMMRSMMGFSSFGTQRPAGKKASDALPSTGSNAAPVLKKVKTGAAPTTIAHIMQQSRVSSSSPLDQSDPDISLATATTSAPGATTTKTTTFQPATAASPLSGPRQSATHYLPPRPSDNDRTSTYPNSTIAPAYISPTNPNYTLTAAELSALRNGRRNGRGDLVFFKPGFVDENPWKALQEMAGAESEVLTKGWRSKQDAKPG